MALRLAPAAGVWLAEAEATGLGDHDYTAVLATILGAAPAPATPQLAAAAPPEPAMRHDGLVLNLDGVVWLAGEPIEGAAEAIAALRALGTRPLFMTNEPARSRAQVAAQLAEIGIEATPADVMTSAAAAARFAGGLKGLPNRRALVVGPPALQDEIREVGFELVPAGAVRDAGVVVVGGHDRFNYDELRDATLAVQNGAPVGNRPGRGLPHTRWIVARDGGRPRRDRDGRRRDGDCGRQARTGDLRDGQAARSSICGPSGQISTATS